MSYPTFIDLAYWTLATLIVLMLWFIVAGGSILLWFRHRRHVRARRSYLQRVEKRKSRALEDACWYLLRPSEAALAQTITDAKAVVRLVRENRRTDLSLVHDEAL